MRTLDALFRAKRKALRKIITEKDFAQILVIVSFFLVILVFIFGSYFFFSSTFSTLRDNPFAEPLNLYLLISSMFLFFTLSIFSSLVTSIFHLFRSKELSFLLTTPISVRCLFLYMFLKIWFVGSWALFVLGIPILFAFGATYSAGLVFYALSILTLFFLSFIATEIGSLLGLLLASIFGSSSFRVLTIGLVFGAVPIAYFLSLSIIPADFSSFFSAENVSSMYVYLQKINILSYPLPSSWLVNMLLGYLGNSFLIVSINIGKLLLFMVLLWFLLLFLASRSFLLSFRKFQEGSFFASPADIARGKSLPFPRFVRGVFGALLEKDIILWVRTFPEMFHFFFLLLLFALYFFVLGRVPVIKQAPPDMLSILTSFHLAAGGYLLTTFALRFVFTSISLEGKGMKFLKSSPVPMSQIFWEKLVFSLVLLLTVSGVMILVEEKLFSVDDVVFSVVALVTSIMSITVTSIMLSFGAAFPEYESQDSERIATTLPGILATLCSLFYVVMVSFFLHDNFSYYFAKLAKGIEVELSSFWPAIGAVFFISLFLDLLILTFGAKSLEKQEV